MFKMTLVQAMPTKVVQTHATAPATQSSASGARARPAGTLGVGFRTADTDNHGNDTGLKADLQVSGAPAVVVFSRYGV